MSTFDHLGFTLLRVFFENPPILLRKKGTFSEEDQKKSKRKLVAEHFYGSWALKYFWWLSVVEATAGEKFSCWFLNNLDSYGMTSGVEKIIFLYHEFCLLPSTSQASVQKFLAHWASLSEILWHRQAQPPSTVLGISSRISWVIESKKIYWER